MSISANCKKNESSSDEEPDYMSDDFLKQCTQTDIRPSLIHNREVKRQHDILRRQQEINKTKQEQEKARLKTLEESLKVPISNENKGFQMLQKMGYKPGASIGKGSDPTRSGIKEPISIELKQDRRGGLGLQRHEEEKHKEIVEKIDPEEFRVRKHNATKRREITGDLRKAQFSCHNLDQEAGLKKPIKAWYWQKQKIKEIILETPSREEGDDFDDFKELGIPKIKKPKLELYSDESDDNESDADDEDEIPDEHKLDSIFDYLRTTYFYCLWCGSKYQDLSEMNTNCPGTSKDDH